MRRTRLSAIMVRLLHCLLLLYGGWQEQARDHGCFDRSTHAVSGERRPRRSVPSGTVAWSTVSVTTGFGLLKTYAPWHFLYFLPEPQGQGSLRPTFSVPRTTCCTVRCSPPPAMRACSSSRRFFRWKASSRSSTEVETWRGGRPLPPPPERRAGTPASGP